MVPSVLERVTRSRPDLDGVMEAERDRDPVLSARLCRAAASSERYRRLRPFSASRGCDFTFYQSPYRWPKPSEGSAVLTELRLGRVARDARVPYLRN